MSGRDTASSTPASAPAKGFCARLAARLGGYFPHLNVRRMAVIVRKELLVLLCNRVSRMLIVVPPLMQIVIFGWAATMEVRNVDVAVLNNDSGRWSREIIHAIEGSPTFRGVGHLQGQGQIRPVIDQQKALFVLVFDEEFSRRIDKGEPAQAQVILDGRRSNAAQIASYYLERMVAQVATATPRGFAMQNDAAEVPRLDIRMRCWFNPNLEFRWFFLPNLIGMLSFMLGLVVTGLSVAREREVGTFDQLLVSPAIPTEIALAKLVPGCLVGMVHGTIFLLISVLGFGVPFSGSVLLLYLAMLVFAAAAGGVGLMVSSLSATQQQAFLGAFTVGVPCILISGAVTPVMNMPLFLQYASQLNPLRHFTEIVQGVFLKDITVVAAVAILGKITCISIVTVSVAVWMFRRKA
ncbi:MAG: ABC transporter permease [Desulfovibrio sp.]|nr:ABC transporter permease [Desulfovibrio sp.]